MREGARRSAQEMTCPVSSSGDISSAKSDLTEYTWSARLIDRSSKRTEESADPTLRDTDVWMSHSVPLDTAETQRTLDL